MSAFLKRITWKPKALAVFAGKLDYPRYQFLDRWMIRTIMWLTGGPTRTDAVVEFTDWRAVDEFARRIGGMKEPPAERLKGPALTSRN